MMGTAYLQIIRETVCVMGECPDIYLPFFFGWQAAMIGIPLATVAVRLALMVDVVGRIKRIWKKISARQKITPLPCIHSLKL